MDTSTIWPSLNQMNRCLLVANPRTLTLLSRDFLPFLFCAIGCGACFVLQKYQDMPSFLASALVGFIGSFVPSSTFYDSKRLVASVYCGSFASMCSLSYFSSLIDVFLLSFITGSYFLLLGNYFRGFGGKLGSIGFISSLSFILLKAIL